MKALDRQCAAYAILSRAAGDFDGANQWEEYARGNKARPHGFDWGAGGYVTRHEVSHEQATAAVNVALGFGVLA